MMLIISVTAVCALLSLFDILKMRKMNTGHVKTLVIYCALMVSAIIMLCVFVKTEDFSLAEILIPNF